MPYTFDASLPTDRDRIRLFFAITGVTATTGLIEDETIDALISQQPTVNLAAAGVARFLAAYFNQRFVDADDGDFKKKYLDRAEFFTKQADGLQNGTILIDGVPVSGFAVAELTEPDLTNYRTT